MRKLLVKIAAAALRFVNLFYGKGKLCRRVVIISRQADEPTPDIRLLDECLRGMGIETAVLTKTLNKSFFGLISYCFHILKQLRYLAASKVVIVDGYCIAVSVLPKREGQSVVQMWHALGAIKKFGWQNTERPDGHSRELAEALCMHRNYDYVLTPSKITGKFFAEAFRVSEDKLRLYCLPRAELLLREDKVTQSRMLKAYPCLKERVNVLYVPTFRKNRPIKLDRFVAGFDFSRFNLIIKKHFLDTADYSWAIAKGAVVDTAFSSMDWLRLCRKVVTDYSAIAFEAALLDKELYIFQGDVSDYSHSVGLNTDLAIEPIGEYVCRTEEELFSSLLLPYDIEKLRSFKAKYIEADTENCTEKLCGFIKELLDR